MSNTTFSDAELLRYSRQILLPDWDIDAQLNLKSARVLMIGMGGLGCPAAQVLARAGLGFLRMVDFDTVDESNLQRQLLFHADDIGQPKVLAAKNSLSKINQWLEIDAIVERVTPENLPELLQNIDLVLDGSDNFETRDQINQACVRAKIPLLSAAAIGVEGQISLFQAATGCYRCVFPDAPEDADAAPILACWPVPPQRLGQYRHTPRCCTLGLAKRRWPVAYCCGMACHSINA